MAVTIPLIGLAHSISTLVAALLVIGLADGLLDVSMNAQAVAVESAVGRPVLQSMHAAFSLGTILGAAGGAVAIWAGASPLTFLTAIAVASALTSLAGTARLLPADVDRSPAERKASQAGRPGWGLFIIVLGLLGAGCLYAGGAAENWTAVFLHTQRHLTEAAATCGYLGFTISQFGGRLVGDRLHQRLGPVLFVRSASAVAGAGLLIALATPGIALPIAGFFVYGLGLSVLVPVIAGAVGHGAGDRYGPDMVALNVTRYTTISYTGFLIGPAVIGWLAQSLGLTTALGTGLLVLAATFALAGYTRTALPGKTGAVLPEAEGAPEAQAMVNAASQPDDRTQSAP
jgi:predicted MFS family arabinose efflux permease